jgi:cellulose synthase (UDP-forming)
MRPADGAGVPAQPLRPRFAQSRHIAGWVAQLGPPSAEPTKSRRLAHVGGLGAVAALTLYIAWRIAFTLPVGGMNRTVAWLLIVFEALPLPGLLLKAVTLWNIDAQPPPASLDDVSGLRVTMLIPS